MERKWTENEEIEREWGNEERFTLYISSLSIHFLDQKLSHLVAKFQIGHFCRECHKKHTRYEKWFWIEYAARNHCKSCRPALSKTGQDLSFPCFRLTGPVFQSNISIPSTFPLLDSPLAFSSFPPSCPPPPSTFLTLSSPPLLNIFLPSPSLWVPFLFFPPPSAHCCLPPGSTPATSPSPATSAAAPSRER